MSAVHMWLFQISWGCVSTKNGKTG